MEGDVLSALENESIYILREAFSTFRKLGMLWSIGKDSTVLLWLARKAFFGHVPFPLVHIDTTYKIPSMIEYRDRVVREWKLQLVVGRNEAVLGVRRDVPERPRHARGVLLDAQEGRSAAVVENSSTPASSSASAATRSRPAPRSVTSRRATARWNGTPSISRRSSGTSSRPTLHPARTSAFIRSCTGPSSNVWEYIEREHIPVIPLYFDDGTGHRYRSLGCAPCTAQIASTARTVSEIVAELRATKTAERAGRAQDQESEDAFERLRRDGYM